MGDGFEPFFRRYGWEWATAAEFRARHMTNALKALTARRRF